MEKHPHRAMEGLHIASALAWQSELLVTAGKKQFEAAVEEGLEPILVG